MVDSDEPRHLWSMRESARATARRILRGPPDALKSVDYWPGEKVESAPMRRLRKVNRAAGTAAYARTLHGCSPTCRPALATRS